MSAESQAVYCSRIMAGIAEHLLARKTVKRFTETDEYVEYPRGHGWTDTEIQSDIRMLRRELLNLSREI